MTECKVMIMASLKKVKARFREYEDMEYEKRGDWILAEDFSGTQLFGWGISDWVELAGDDELIYAYYDEDMNAEFIHVRDGVCVRAYMQYDGEADIDEGEDTETSVRKWSDVGNYMDKYMI